MPDTPAHVYTPGDTVTRRFGIAATQAGELGKIIDPDGAAGPTDDHVRVRWANGVTVWKLPSQLVYRPDPAQAAAEAPHRVAAAQAALASLNTAADEPAARRTA